MHKFIWRKPNLNQIVVTDTCKGSSTNSKQADEKFLGEVKKIQNYH